MGNLQRILNMMKAVQGTILLSVCTWSEKYIYVRVLHAFLGYSPNRTEGNRDTKLEDE